MKKIVYSLHDMLVGYGSPFFVNDDENADKIAIRDTKEGMLTIPLEIAKFKAPQIYLEKIGIFDTKTGCIESINPEVICCTDSLIVERKDKNEVPETV